jgi:hypothetical protein
LNGFFNYRRERENFKLETPSSKEIPITKLQSALRYLELGASLELGIWSFPLLPPPAAMIVGGADVDPRAVVIWVRIRIGIAIGRRRPASVTGRWFLWFPRHVEVDLARDAVFDAPGPAGIKSHGLGVLIRVRGKGADDVIIRPEIVEGAIGITPDFEAQRALANNLAINLDLDAWF